MQCTEDGERMVVFDFMERGSVCEILDKRPASLGWKERIGVALGECLASCRVVFVFMKWFCF